MHVHCPNCGHPQTCPCPSPACQGGNPTAIPWRELANGHILACGKCSLTKPADWWADLEFDITTTTEEKENVNVITE